MVALEHVGTVVLPGTERFVTGEHIRKTEYRLYEIEGVLLYKYDVDFYMHFLKGGGKVELGVSPVSLQIYQLREYASDYEIISELGRDAIETTVFQMWEMLKTQGCGQEGPLQTCGFGNIFYIRDIDGKLRQVIWLWDDDGGGWRVCSYPAMVSPEKVCPGCRIVSSLAHPAWRE